METPGGAFPQQLTQEAQTTMSHEREHTRGQSSETASDLRFLQRRSRNEENDEKGKETKSRRVRVKGKESLVFIVGFGGSERGEVRQSQDMERVGGEGGVINSLASWETRH